MSEITKILRKTRDELVRLHKAYVVMPKYERKLEYLYRKHLKKLSLKTLAFMKEKGYLQLIYNDAQSTLKKERKIPHKDNPKTSFLHSLFRQEDLDKWFDKDNFDEKWMDTLASAYKEIADQAFSSFGVYIEFDKMDPRIQTFLSERMNFVKDLPEESFHSLIDILQEQYYERGEDVAKIAKLLQSKELYDEYYSGRSLNIARTETSVATGKASYQEHSEQGFARKYWIDTPDERTRDAHVENGAAGEIAMDQAYPSGQMHPGDGNDPGLVINCRCSEGYTSVDPENDQEFLLGNVLSDSLSSEVAIKKDFASRKELIELVSSYISRHDITLFVTKKEVPLFRRNRIAIQKKKTNIFDLLKVIAKSAMRLMELAISEGVLQEVAETLVGYKKENEKTKPIIDFIENNQIT